MIKSTSNKLLLTNIILFFLALIADKFWTELGLTDSENIYFALVGFIIFGISVGGAFVGFKERKEKENKPLIGLIGNLILTLFFLITFFYVALTMEL
jgi:glucose-6-phosphate-specific signal transduction histidine kinase